MCYDSTHMRQLPLRDSLFLSLWRSLTPSARGGWNEDELGRGQAARFRDEELLAIDDFVKPPELGLLIALVQSCEGWFGSKPLGSSYDLEEMQQTIRCDEDSYKEVPELIGLISRDMLHVGASRSTYLALERSYLTATPAKKRGERKMFTSSQWLLWLNDDFRGGELIFPTRRVAFPPRAGTIVRWPRGIPHAIALANEGYRFSLSGRSV